MTRRLDRSRESIQQDAGGCNGTRQDKCLVRQSPDEDFLVSGVDVVFRHKG
jgi:hypothetical protein